jgi:hypothetical protein
LFRSKETYKKQERVHLFWRPDPWCRRLLYQGSK